MQHWAKPNELGNLIENNHDDFSRNNVMLQSKASYSTSVPNKLLAPEKLAHHVLLLFYPFRDEKELQSGFSTISGLSK